MTGIVYCAFCRCTKSRDNAPLEGWIPDFWVGNYEICEPVCPECYRTLRFSCNRDCESEIGVDFVRTIYRYDFVSDTKGVSFYFMHTPTPEQITVLASARPGCSLHILEVDVDFDPDKKKEDKMIRSEVIDGFITRFEATRDDQCFKDWSAYEDLVERKKQHNSLEVLKALDTCVEGALCNHVEEYYSTPGDQRNEYFCATYVRDLAQLLVDIRQALL